MYEQRMKKRKKRFKDKIREKKAKKKYNFCITETKNQYMNQLKCYSTNEIILF